MSRRMLPSLGAPLAVLSMMLVGTVSGGGQAPAAGKNGPAPKKAASKSTVPRTAWGDPDLQGTWNNGTITPLERARGGGEKELLSKEEEAEVNEQSDTRAERRPADRAQDLELAYDQVWWDRGASIGRTSLIIDPKDGRLPPLTPDGQKMVDARAAARRTRGFADSWVDRPLQERCILYHGVPPLPTGYNNNYEIAQAPGLVAILHEEIHEVRLIHLDGRPHIGARASANGWAIRAATGKATRSSSRPRIFTRTRRSGFPPIRPRSASSNASGESAPRQSITNSRSTIKRCTHARGRRRCR